MPLFHRSFALQTKRELQSPAVPHGFGESGLGPVRAATVALPRFLLRFEFEANGAWLPVPVLPRRLGVSRLGEPARALLAWAPLRRASVNGVLHVVGIVL